MYHVDVSTRAEKFIDKLDNHLRLRIEERLKKLKDNPIPSDAKFIGRDEMGEKIFRYRIGAYRALYKIKEQEQIILISKIDKRPRVYD
ncbi:type II toxin-antitoxin system RelE/ParE family toxin [Candidatus Woesearchaeota archaeon]|nr:type II toxin-antitoxin system RelE/ParE family toxin [Candidatus Woesearchaeota archaeon]